jgi:hypothetical protein
MESVPKLVQFLMAENGQAVRFDELSGRNHQDFVQ